MLLRPVSVSLLAFLAVTGARADWWSNYIASRVHISGYRNIGIHFDQITGDSEAYGQENYGGEGNKRITDLGYIRIEGRKVFDILNFDINVQDSRFQDPQANNVTLDFTKGNWGLGLGDIQGNLGGSNPFVNFSRKLRGGTAGYKSKNFTLRALHTSARGDPRSISISGNNTAGPYYLQSSQIVRGSESISVDGVVQRFGDDYTIDYDLGSITFQNRTTGSTKVISPASTIVATYESLNFGGTAGTVDGGYMGIDIPKLGHLGVTGVRQASGSNNQSSTREEQFQGFGPPSVPYTLQFQPVLGIPVVIRVDGVLQVEGIDYHFDSANSAVFFMNRFVPTTSTVDVLYTPISNSNSQGDRTAYGLDLTMPLGRGGVIKLSEARGSLSNTSVPRSGGAMGAILNYGWKNLTFNADVHKIDDDFVSVQSASFSRNENSTGLGVTYTPNPERRLDLRYLNSAIANVSSTGITRGRLTNASVTQTVSSGIAGNLPVTFDLEHTASEDVGIHSVADTLAVNSHIDRGRFNSSFGLSDSRIGGNSEANIASFNTTTRYSAAKSIYLRLGASFSHITTRTQSGLGRDVTLTAGWTPSDRLTTRLTLEDSDSGGVDTLGAYTGGFGIGVGGNGFSNAPETLTAYSAASGTKMQFDVEAKPTDKTVFGLGVYSNLQKGSVTSNALTQGVNAYGTLEASDRFRLQGLLGLTRTSYDGSDATPTSTTLSLDADGNLGKRWSYSARFSSLASTGNTGFDQSNAAFETNLNYALANRQTLSLSFSGSHTSGYLPQDLRDLALTYRYQIWKALGLNLSYRDEKVKNLDPTVTTGAYESRGLHLEFAFTFG